MQKLQARPSPADVLQYIHSVTRPGCGCKWMCEILSCGSTYRQIFISIRMTGQVAGQKFLWRPGRDAHGGDAGQAL